MFEIWDYPHCNKKVDSRSWIQNPLGPCVTFKKKKKKKKGFSVMNFVHSYQELLFKNKVICPSDPCA
jgi:hypothetical protein